MKRVGQVGLVAGLVLAIASHREALANPSTQYPAEVPAGTYVLDKSHASLTVKILHMGFSDYALRFNGLDRGFTYDPSTWKTTAVSFTVDPNSADTNNPAFSTVSAEVVSTPRGRELDISYGGQRGRGVRHVVIPANVTIREMSVADRADAKLGVAVEIRAGQAAAAPLVARAILIGDARQPVAR